MWWSGKEFVAFQIEINTMEIEGFRLDGLIICYYYGKVSLNKVHLLSIGSTLPYTL